MKPFFFIFLCVFLQTNVIFGQVAQNKWSASSVNAFYDSLNDAKKKIEIDAAFDYLTTQKKFNGLVLISKKDKILIHKAIGYANFPKRIKLSTKTMFELASVSKQFTATSIMILEERGLLSYTDTIQRFIPNFPYKGITIHHLLCHRSGLPHYYNFAPKYWKYKNLDLSNDSLMSMMAMHKPSVRFAPNEKYEYNNTGYCVLAAIVENVSKKTFADFVEQEIFEKCGMKNSIVCTKLKTRPFDPVAVGHTAKRKVRAHTWLSGTTGDKGVYSTAYDLYLWDKALRNHKIIKSETLIHAVSGKSADRPIDNNYGYGWHLGKNYWGVPLVYHGGLWNGFNTLFIKRLNDDVFIIVLSNITNWSFSRQSNNWFEMIDAI